MPNLIWNNFSTGWLCIVLLSVTLGIFIVSDKRPHDVVWRIAVVGCSISIIISVFMLLYDISIWLSIH
jgi:hypothetical protein